MSSNKPQNELTVCWRGSQARLSTEFPEMRPTPRKVLRLVREKLELPTQPFSFLFREKESGEQFYGSKLLAWGRTYDLFVSGVDPLPADLDAAKEKEPEQDPTLSPGSTSQVRSAVEGGYLSLLVFKGRLVRCLELCRAIENSAGEFLHHQDDMCKKFRAWMTDGEEWKDGDAVGRRLQDMCRMAKELHDHARDLSQSAYRGEQL